LLLNRTEYHQHWRPPQTAERDDLLLSIRGVGCMTETAKPRPRFPPHVSSDTPLMARERLLVAEYLVDLHGADAAIRVGYAARSAQITASRLPAKLTFRRRWPQETFGGCAASANMLPQVKHSVGVPRATGTALIGFSGLRRPRA
jgi:hypothetical protein